MLSFFPLDVLDEIWDLVGSVSEGFPSYSSKYKGENLRHDHALITVNIFSTKNNLQAGKKISYISGLTGPISMP